MAATAAANERIGIGIIGCGGMGRMDLTDFHKQPDVEIRAVCDVFRPAANQARQMTSDRAEVYSDFRRVLDRKDVDAVVIATPDHWHALIAILACEAGKDIYVEKPISHNVREGRLMVEAARRTNRVAQVGIQQRSGTHFQRAVKAVQEGRIGAVHFAQCWNHNHAQDPKGMGFPAETAPRRPIWIGTYGWGRRQKCRTLRRAGTCACSGIMRGAELTNWCVHLLDVVHWALGARSAARR